MNTIEISSVAVTFQAFGTLLLAFMLRQIGRNFDCPFARQWAWAWLAMFAAIGSVRVYIATGHRELWVVYLVAQWTSILLLYSGCRELTERRIAIRYALYLLPVASALAAVLTNAVRDFNGLFMIEATVVGSGSLICFLALGHDTRRTTGWQMMRLALVLMAALYFCYVPLYALYELGVSVPFLPYSSLADLLASTLLGFGMVIVASEDARRELIDAVQALQVARDQLELKLKTDPLTEALTRHAFYSMTRGMNGVVVMIDVDNLKRINDVAGHAAGDAAIRAVANAVRTRIRADDLLFRWGGDEFLLLVPGSTLDLVRGRLDALAGGVTTESGTLVCFSWGAADFGAHRPLDAAMREADAQMYARRAALRTA